MLCSRTNNFHLQINNINNHVINVIYNIIIRSSVTCIHYKEVKSLLQKQVIQHLPTLPVRFYSNMFMVPKKGGGQRPVINLKYLNHFMKSEHFKMEGLHTVKTLLRKNDWMAKIDPEQIHSTLLLLENAGFIINNKKSLLDPTQETEFLVKIINSVKMDISLPGEKIRQEAQKLLNHLRPSAHLLSQLVGKLNATTPALQMAPLFCRSLQRCLKQALETNISVPFNYLPRL